MCVNRCGAPGVVSISLMQGEIIVDVFRAGLVYTEFVSNPMNMKSYKAMLAAEVILVIVVV